MAEKKSFTDSAGREHTAHEISREEATKRWVDAGMPMGPAPSVVVLDGKSYVPDSPDEVAGTPSRYSTGSAEPPAGRGPSAGEADHQYSKRVDLEGSAAARQSGAVGRSVGRSDAPMPAPEPPPVSMPSRGDGRAPSMVGRSDAPLPAPERPPVRMPSRGADRAPSMER